MAQSQMEMGPVTSAAEGVGGPEAKTPTSARPSELPQKAPSTDFSPEERAYISSNLAKLDATALDSTLAASQFDDAQKAEIRKLVEESRSAMPPAQEPSSIASGLASASRAVLGDPFVEAAAAKEPQTISQLYDDYKTGASAITGLGKNLAYAAVGNIPSAAAGAGVTLGLTASGLMLGPAAALVGGGIAGATALGLNEPTENAIRDFFGDDRVSYGFWENAFNAIAPAYFAAKPVVIAGFKAAPEMAPLLEKVGRGTQALQAEAVLGASQLKEAAVNLATELYKGRNPNLWTEDGIKKLTEAVSSTFNNTYETAIESGVSERAAAQKAVQTVTRATALGDRLQKIFDGLKLSSDADSVLPSFIKEVGEKGAALTAQARKDFVLAADQAYRQRAGYPGLSISVDEFLGKFQAKINEYIAKTKLLRAQAADGVISVKLGKDGTIDFYITNPGQRTQLIGGNSGDNLKSILMSDPYVANLIVGESGVASILSRYKEVTRLSQAQMRRGIKENVILSPSELDLSRITAKRASLQKKYQDLLKQPGKEEEAQAIADSLGIFIETENKMLSDLVAAGERGLVPPRFAAMAQQYANAKELSNVSIEGLKDLAALTTNTPDAIAQYILNSPDGDKVAKALVSLARFEGPLPANFNKFGSGISRDNLQAIANQMIMSKIDVNVLKMRTMTGEPDLATLKYLQKNSGNNPIAKMFADENFVSRMKTLVGADGFGSFKSQLLSIQTELDKLSKGINFARKQNNSQLVDNLVSTAATTAIRKLTGGFLSSGVFYTFRELWKNSFGKGNAYDQLTRALFTKDFDMVVKGVNSISDVANIQRDIINAFGRNSPEALRFLTDLDVGVRALFLDRQAILNNAKIGVMTKIPTLGAQHIYPMPMPNQPPAPEASAQ